MHTHRQSSGGDYGGTRRYHLFYYRNGSSVTQQEIITDLINYDQGNIIADRIGHMKTGDTYRFQMYLDHTSSPAIWATIRVTGTVYRVASMTAL